MGDFSAEGAIFGVASSLIDSSLNNYYAQQQMNYQAKLNRQQYDYEFNKEASYNSPSSERARLEYAGLNPALMYENGAGGSSVNASLGNTGLSHLPGSNVAGSLIAGAESMARIRNLNADTGQKLTETDYNQKAMQTRLDILSEEKLARRYANLISRVDVLYKEKLTKETLRKLQQEIDGIASEIAYRKDLTQIEKDKLLAYQQSLTRQYALWDSQIKLNEEQVKTEGTKQELNTAQTFRANAEGYEATQRGDRVHYESEILRDLFMNTDFSNKIVERINSDINRNNSIAGLNDENSKYVRAYVLLKAIDTGTNTLEAISSEWRKWADYFLRKSKEDGKLKTLLDAAGENVSYDDVLELLQLFGSFAE